VNILGVLWHPGCFCCRACHKPIAIHDIENHVWNCFFWYINILLDMFVLFFLFDAKPKFLITILGFKLKRQVSQIVL